MRPLQLWQRAKTTSQQEILLIVIFFSTSLPNVDFIRRARHFVNVTQKFIWHEIIIDELNLDGDMMRGKLKIYVVVDDEWRLGGVWGGGGG